MLPHRRIYAQMGVSSALPADAKAAR
jgi:hypothetical protein